MEAEIISKITRWLLQKARAEQQKKDKEVLMVFRFIIYGSPGWMLTEAKMFLHTQELIEVGDFFLNERLFKLKKSINIPSNFHILKNHFATIEISTALS